MRLVQVMVPAGKRETVLSTLDEEGIDYALSEETSGRNYTAVVSFPLPTAAVEPVLERLRDVGLERNAYTVVLNAETVASDRFEELQRRYEEEGTGDDDRIAREELEVNAREMAPNMGQFVVMTVISAVVATAGVLLNSAPVVVGSMVIAPLIGPAMSTSVGTVLGEDDMFREGVKLQALGAILGIVSAAVFAALIRYGQIVPFDVQDVLAISEVRRRLAPGVLSLPIALGSGVAGALSVSTGVSSVLVGVMIAAALVPPMAVVGIGVAWGEPVAVSGAALLVAVNYVSINFAALGTLWYKGYRPDRFWLLDETRTTTLKRVAVLGVAILLATGALAGITVSSYESAQFSTTAQTEAEALLPNDASVISVEVTYGAFPFRQPESVMVTVGYPPDEQPPLIADRLSDRLGDNLPSAFGRQSESVDVSVRYIPVENSQVATGEGSSSGEESSTGEESSSGEEGSPTEKASIGGTAPSARVSQTAL